MITFHQFLFGEAEAPPAGKPPSGGKGAPPVPGGPPGAPPGLGGPPPMMGGMGGPPPGLGGPPIGGASLGGGMPGMDAQQPAQPQVKMQSLKPLDVWDALEKSVSEKKPRREKESGLKSGPDEDSDIQ